MNQFIDPVTKETVKTHLIKDVDFYVHPFGYVCFECGSRHYTHITLLEKHMKEIHGK